MYLDRNDTLQLVDRINNLSIRSSKIILNFSTNAQSGAGSNIISRVCARELLDSRESDADDLLQLQYLGAEFECNSTAKDCFSFGCEEKLL